MASFTARLDAADDLAEQGDPDGALALLEELKPGLEPGDSSVLHLLIASITARSGQLQQALDVLQMAEALANAGARPDVALEVVVTRASVLAALGEYDDAIPMLTGAIAALGAHPQLAQLRADAEAELRSYQNLVSPKR